MQLMRLLIRFGYGSGSGYVSAKVTSYVYGRSHSYSYSLPLQKVNHYLQIYFRETRASDVDVTVPGTVRVKDAVTVKVTDMVTGYRYGRRYGYG